MKLCRLSRMPRHTVPGRTDRAWSRRAIRHWWLQHSAEANSPRRLKKRTTKIKLITGLENQWEINSIWWDNLECMICAAGPSVLFSPNSLIILKANYDDDKGWNSWPWIPRFLMEFKMTLSSSEAEGEEFFFRSLWPSPNSRCCPCEFCKLWKLQKKENNWDTLHITHHLMLTWCTPDIWRRRRRCSKWSWLL